jgi:hypothetical protein
LFSSPGSSVAQAREAVRARGSEQIERGAASDYHINIFYGDEDGGYIADIPDLDSCAEFVRTAEEALENETTVKWRP